MTPSDPAKETSGDGESVRGAERSHAELDAAGAQSPPLSGAGAAGGSVPAWMLGAPAPAAAGHAAPPAAGHPAPAAAPRRRRWARSWADGLLDRLARWVESAFVSDEVARRRGLLQRVDPRVKLLGLVALIVVSVFATRLLTLGLLVGVAVVLVLASRIGFGRFVLRAWVFIPLFTAAIVLPATLNVVTPGHQVLVLWHDPPWPVSTDALAVTSEGLAVAARLVLRVTAAVSFAVLLTLTTPWADLLRALRVVGVPRMFVFVLAIAYRYVFTLVRLVQDMTTARKSRTVGRAGSREDRRFAGAAAAAVWGKSQATSEAVYLSMLSRGYSGDARSLSDWSVGRLDVVWGAAIAMAIAALIWLEIAAPGIG